MVSLESRLQKIKKEYIDYGSYFVINKGRQYGKTTTLRALAKYLKEDYIVFSLDFQKMGTEDFVNAPAFVHAFAEIMLQKAKLMEPDGGADLIKPLSEFLDSPRNQTMATLFMQMSRMCAKAPKPVVLIIDEVDSGSNNQVFIDFLAQLRGYYLDREETSTFHSVILASVYDIKNLKLKLRPESEHQYNSPWNIAADFEIEMSFSPGQIADMLAEYEAEHHTGMHLPEVAEEIYAYTSGYPVLVSSICKHIDEKIAPAGDIGNIADAWSKKGVAQAAAMILKEKSPLFESMAKQLDTYADLHTMIEDILYRGKRIPFSPEEKSISLGVMFGFLTEKNNHVAIANRLFEMSLLNLFMAREAICSDVFSQGESDRTGFIKNNKLDMDLVLQKFVEYFQEIYGKKDMKFIEAYGRKFFLLYLKPIINGTGNYYLEAETRDARRTDVIVDYLGEQFIVELKIWHGNEYNERGEQQLIDYLDYYHQKKGYMLSFNFNQNKEAGIKELKIGVYTIVEAIV